MDATLNSSIGKYTVGTPPYNIKKMLSLENSELYVYLLPAAGEIPRAGLDVWPPAPRPPPASFAGGVHEGILT